MPRPLHEAGGAVDSAAWSAAIARGDEAAFAAFYAAWFPATLALARAVSRRDEAFCLDVVQDVMFAVCRRMPALPDEPAVRGWMRSAVAHAITDRVRQEQARRRREEHVAEERGDAHDGEPWHALLRDERAQWLAARLAELPASDQALLAARFADGPSVAAVGATFGLSEDGAHGRLRRALQRLRHLATEWWHGS
ncbi:MAG: sigma-70 family RNA polymerase sigma factor [Planctomycetes bacterium]|nr:sigma-70 family RNA polymerase sigma factor [Planctomycetota bacterium]